MKATILSARNVKRRVGTRAIGLVSNSTHRAHIENTRHPVSEDILDDYDFYNLQDYCAIEMEKYDKKIQVLKDSLDYTSVNAERVRFDHLWQMVGSSLYDPNFEHYHPPSFRKVLMQEFDLSSNILDHLTKKRMDSIGRGIYEEIKPICRICVIIEIKSRSGHCFPCNTCRRISRLIQEKMSLANDKLDLQAGHEVVYCPEQVTRKEGKPDRTGWNFRPKKTKAVRCAKKSKKTRVAKNYEVQISRTHRRAQQLADVF